MACDFLSHLCYYLLSSQHKYTMKLKNTLIFILLLALLTGAAQADFLDATEAYEKKQYDTAFKEFSELARLGNKRAQFNLGVMYLNGEGVEKDLSLAYAWGKLSEHDARPEFTQISKEDCHICFRKLQILF